MVYITRGKLGAINSNKERQKKLVWGENSYILNVLTMRYLWNLPTEMVIQEESEYRSLIQGGL